MKKPLERFMEGVKRGRIRGDYVQERLQDNVVAEISVGPFENGYAHLRVIVDEDQIAEDVEEGMYFRRLYSVNSEYEAIHNTLKERVEEENETPISNAHVYEARDPERRIPDEWLPTGFDPETTVFFETHIQLRDDVTIIEALETNRTD